MKKFYSFTLSVLCPLMLLAQEYYSFETAEGFHPGGINGQKGWICKFETSAQDFETQKITDEKFSDGSYSLELAQEATLPQLSNLSLGAAKNFDTPLSYNDFSLSLDFNIAEEGSSDFSVQGINTSEQFYVFYFKMRYNGSVAILDNSNGNVFFGETYAQWQPEKWSKLKIESASGEIKYYLDGQLIYTGKAASEYDIQQLALLHDNYGGSAAFDNISIDHKTLSSNEKQQERMSIYPNPASDFIRTDFLCENPSVQDLSGRKIPVKSVNSGIDIRNLTSGNYILSCGKNGNIRTFRFVKK